MKIPALSWVQLPTCPQLPSRLSCSHLHGAGAEPLGGEQPLCVGSFVLPFSFGALNLSL